MNLSTIPITACAPSAIAPPTILGAEILSLSASPVTNFSFDVFADFNYNHGEISVTNASFCNITVTYAHPGQNDIINVETWLPLSNWNERLQATGGGGWQAGRFALSQFFMAGAIGEGYAATTTDAGLGDSPTSWALKSDGNVDLYALQNLGSRSLHDQAVIGKSLVRSFYGRDPAYSYWSGCSQGGRQGLMLAQRYPTAYDGIAASAPAIYWPQFVSSFTYPYLFSNWAQESPQSCELEYLTAEAIAYCDPMDGVIDGLISDVSFCNYDPFNAVNSTFNCSSTGHTMQLSKGAAMLADAVWSGARSTQGEFLWYGLNPGANISGFGNDGANAQAPSGVQGLWIGLFLQKLQNYNNTVIDHEDFDWLFHLGVQEYTDIIGTADPDLTKFHKAGGKLISYHGMVSLVSLLV